MSSPNLTARELAERWGLRLPTLRQWRWYNKGPDHFKVGGRVLYKIEVIEKFEEDALKHNTTITDDMPMDF